MPRASFGSAMSTLPLAAATSGAVAMTLPLSVTVTVPTGALPSFATILPVTLTVEPYFASSLFGPATTAVSTDCGAASTSTATDRAGTVTVPVAASHVVVFTTASDPFA